MQQVKVRGVSGNVAALAVSGPRLLIVVEDGLEKAEKGSPWVKSLHSLAPRRLLRSAASRKRLLGY